MTKKEYQICNRCIMDTSDSKIEFDENSICNHCRGYDKKIGKQTFRGEIGKQRLNEILKEIKEKGQNQKYDCVVGISGGVDSTYVVHLSKELGLRPLAVHLDNGWNTKTATMNISKILKKLDIDLYTYVIDWEEFKDLQLSYLRASVIDIEALTDHAIKTVLYKVANEKNIKYILTGTNVATEGIMGSGWTHNKGDYTNIIGIHKEFGKIRLKTFPILTLFGRVHYQGIKKIKMIEILNYLDYDKNGVKAMLLENYGWEDYGRKHGESMFTQFYQEYILPRKFKVDKRRAHFSALICAGQMSREEALREIEKPLFNEEQLKKDKEYVLKKFGLTEKEFEEIMSLPIKNHHDYRSSDKFLRSIGKIYQKLISRG